MKKKRQAISKKTRFEVFKRDGFSCQYCGAHPPAVTLQVDHIVAVAKGGDNGMDNLITACQPCNLGKSANSLTDVPQSLKTKAADIAEREEQLKGYHAVIEGRRHRIDDESWGVAEVLRPGCSQKGFPKDWRLSIRSFLEKLDYWTVLGAMERAAIKQPYSESHAFRYFCGICWNKIKENDGTR